MNKRFLKSGNLRKTLNIYTIEISYSCMPDLENKISKHNHKVVELNKTSKNEERTCRYKIKANCSKWYMFNQRRYLQCNSQA